MTRERRVLRHTPYHATMLSSKRNIFFPAWSLGTKRRESCPLVLGAEECLVRIRFYYHREHKVEKNTFRRGVTWGSPSRDQNDLRASSWIGKAKRNKTSVARERNRDTKSLSRFDSRCVNHDTRVSAIIKRRERIIERSVNDLKVIVRLFATE